MDITATTETTVRSVNIHGCQDMRAEARSLPTTGAAVWLYQKGDKPYMSDISLMLSGPGAYEKAQRIADAINAALTEPLTLQVAAE